MMMLNTAGNLPAGKMIGPVLHGLPVTVNTLRKMSRKSSSQKNPSLVIIVATGAGPQHPLPARSVVFPPVRRTGVDDNHPRIAERGDGPVTDSQCNFYFVSEIRRHFVQNPRFTTLFYRETNHLILSHSSTTLPLSRRIPFFREEVTPL